MSLRTKNDQSVVRSVNSPHSALKSTNLTDITWTEGFWKEKVGLVCRVTIPHLYDVMHVEEQGKSIHNMMIAAGRKSGDYKGNDWQDEWIYKWIEMAVLAWTSDPESEVLRKVDELIELIGEAQEEDGYLSTNVQVKHKERFADPIHHEWYNMGHLLTAAVIHHRFTGKDNFLQIALKVADYAYKMFKNRPDEMAHFPINPSIIMGAVEMYRETGDSKYLELANLVIDNRGKYDGGSDNWQDRVPLRDEREIVGHAVWNTYLYAGATDAFLETGDHELLDALERIWKDLVEKKLYIHGGMSALYRGFSFRDGNVWGADEVWESTGFDYQMPNAHGYNETCGQVGNFMWNYRMLLATGEARFAEIMELEMYNGFLGSMGQDGRGFFYVNPTRWHGHEQPPMKNSSLQRGIPGSENIGICCPTNFSRTLAGLHGLFYSKSQDAFWIHHYGASRYDDGEYVFEQKTDFPWEGKVVVKIEKWKEGTSLKVRVPEWAEGASVVIDGKVKSELLLSGYHEIEQLPEKGLEIVIDLPMDVKLMQGIPRIEETTNQVAIKRGPLLYTMEEADLPSGVDIGAVYLPVNAEFEVLWEENLLGGVNSLTASAYSCEGDSWGNRLYRPLKPAEFKPLELKLIPYFAWANRGVGKMSVWMNVIHEL
ncbi:MAG: glycoside hydrolase family 127 protein [Opitutales bacterium]|nr:glycoside hydrolase family 127 protein [Opitutales bacterium]